MKKIALFFSFLAVYMPSFAQLGYWYHTDFIKLTPKNDSVVYLSFKDKTANHKQEIYARSECLNVLSQFNDNDYLVKKIDSIDFRNCYVSTKYEIKENGGEIVILPQIAISVKDPKAISFVLNKYKKVLSVCHNTRDIYVLDCEVLSSDEVLKLSMDISRIEGINWCEPNRLLDAELCNTYYPYQFYLNNLNGEDINVESAWSITTGSPTITVAVIDCGVDKNHEDLSANIVNGYTVDNPSGLGSPLTLSPGHSHGTACAGIIGAVNNSKGIRGVANGVKILPINISTGSSDINGNPILVDPFKRAQAIEWAVNNGADVLSCSWHSNSQSPYLDSAIAYANTNGRNMKGCVVVFSSGNAGTNVVSYPASLSGVVAVGAIDRDGQICHYSQRGDSLDLVAPSNKYFSTGEIYTTYITGQGNIGNNNYTTSFGGTSAACPQVAGVAALILSVNPNLTANQVRSILCNTAKDLGSPGFDTTYGYGLVNAYAAVRSLLVGDKIVGPELVYTYNMFYVEDLPDYVTVSWSLTDSYYNSHLLTDFPEPEQCVLFRDNSHDMMNETLTADIYYNNVWVQTLTKTVSAYAGFRGHYTSAVGSGDINEIYPFYVKPNWTYHITSPNFYGATVTYDSSGAAPYIFTFSPTYGDLTFVTTNTNMPVYINVYDGCYNYYQLVAIPDNTPATSFSISNGYNSITVTLNRDGDAERGSTSDLPWTIEVRNATTGALMITQSSTSRSETISTVGWPKGIYIVKVTNGIEVLTEKVIVK